jgi:hypothetical protein
MERALWDRDAMITSLFSEDRVPTPARPYEIRYMRALRRPIFSDSNDADYLQKADEPSGPLDS